MKKRLLVILSLCSLFLVARAEALTCTLVWNPVTTYTNGSPATGINYKLYFAPSSTGIPGVIDNTPLTTSTFTCASGIYTVTAYDQAAVESVASNSVVLLSCTFNWNPVTLDTNGNPAVGTVLYKVKYYPIGAANPVVFLDPMTVGTVIPCPPGSYYTTAYTSSNGEGGGSNLVVVRVHNSPIVRSTSN